MWVKNKDDNFVILIMATIANPVPVAILVAVSIAPFGPGLLRLFLAPAVAAALGKSGNRGDGQPGQQR